MQKDHFVLLILLGIAFVFGYFVGQLSLANRYSKGYSDFYKPNSENVLRPPEKSREENRQPGLDSCQFKGKTYQDGEGFKDSCNSCSCENGNVSCTLIACEGDY